MIEAAVVSFAVALLAGISWARMLPVPGARSKASPPVVVTPTLPGARAIKTGRSA